MISSLVILLCLSFSQQQTVALQVTPGSSCSAVCLDDSNGDPAGSSTNSSDIVCNDQEYSTTVSGIRFKNCVECLQESHAMTDKENDVSWYLYNIRYSVDVCLYGFPNATKTISSPCDIDYACRPLKKALEIGNLNPNNGTQLDYCSADGGVFNGSHLQDCVQCFRSSPNQFYLSNFLTALKAGCEQTPQPGNLIGLSGSLFTQFEVNITAPPQNQTEAANDTSSTTMTTGAIVGIVVGAVLLFLGGTGLFWVYHRKQKYLYGDSLGSDGGRKSITPPLPPAGGYPHYYEGRKDPLPADWEMRTQGAFNNNAQYYDQMEKAVQAGQRSNYTFNPHALPTHPAYLPRVSSRTGSRTDTPSPPPQIGIYRPEPPQPKPTLAPAPIITTAAATNGRQYLQPPQPQTQPQLVPPPPATLPLRDASLSYNHPQATHTATLPAAAPPPPPPPAAPRAPRLSMPTKARKPTKYIPPRIIVDRPSEYSSTLPHAQAHNHHNHHDEDSDSEADDADEVLSIGLEIQRPTPGLVPDGVPRWEQESYAGYGVRTGTPLQPPQYHQQQQQQHQYPQHQYQQPSQVVEQRVVDRRRRETEFTDLGSPMQTYG
ncbi:hypothetical protein F5Y04DRAFT_167962 [Hypomontagnella monticulosa]|nr:hypothetical protein F5Y04DRAFT_167962 [Hypomontagnella monticulosa]